MAVGMNTVLVRLVLRQISCTAGRGFPLWSFKDSIALAWASVSTVTRQMDVKILYMSAYKMTPKFLVKT